MSKASEWAKLEPPEFALPSPNTATVTRDVRLYISGDGNIFLPADVALEFARWIIDTFGEPGA